MEPITAGVVVVSVEPLLIERPLRPAGRRERAYCLMWICLVDETRAQVFVQTLPTPDHSRTSARHRLLGGNLVFSGSRTRSRRHRFPAGSNSLSWLGLVPDTFGVPSDGHCWCPSGTVCVRSGQASDHYVGPGGCLNNARASSYIRQAVGLEPTSPSLASRWSAGSGGCRDPRGHLSKPSSGPHGLQPVRP